MTHRWNHNRIRNAFAMSGEEPDDAYSVIGFTDQGTGAMPGRDDESSADDAYDPSPRSSPGYGSGRGGLW